MPESGTGRETGAHTQQLLRQAPLPDLVGIRRLVRRRRHRRLGMLVGSIVLVLACANVLVAHRTDQHSAEQRQEMARRPAASASQEPTGTFSYTNAALAPDGSNGVAVRHTCRVGGCRVLVWHTGDQGRSWTPTKALPSLLGLPSSPLTPTVTEEGTAALLDAAGQPTLTLGPGGGWHYVRQSARLLDHLTAARGWLLSTGYGQTVGVAPRYNTVRGCNLSASWCRPLAHQPPIARLTWVQLDGRRLWAAGLSGSGAALVAISSDAGHSWRSVPLAGPPVDTVTVTDTAGGRGVIVGSREREADYVEGWRLSALWTVVDSGRTVRLAEREPDRPLVVTALLALPNSVVGAVQTQFLGSAEPTGSAPGGSVPAGDDGAQVPLTRAPALRLSDDGGATYGPARPLPGKVLSVSRAGTPTLLYGTDGSYLVLSSDLGRSWHRRIMP